MEAGTWAKQKRKPVWTDLSREMGAYVGCPGAANLPNRFFFFWITLPFLPLLLDWHSCSLQETLYRIGVPR